MYPAILSLCMYSALCVVPDRRSPDEPKTQDVEATWYGQLRRDGRITVNLDGGRIVFVPNGIVNRKLIDVIITRYDDKGQAIFVGRAKEAQIRFDTTNRLLAVTVDSMHTTFVDSGESVAEIQIIQFQLPPSK